MSPLILPPGVGRGPPDELAGTQEDQEQPQPLHDVVEGIVIEEGVDRDPELLQRGGDEREGKPRRSDPRPGAPVPTIGEPQCD
jgi:hypothetical protein